MEVIALISLHDGDEADSAAAEFSESMGQAAPYQMAYIRAWRRNVDAAFESLERALEQRAISMSFILSSPFFKNLEEDPRWDDLLDRIGLLDAYVAMKQREGEGGS